MKGLQSIAILLLAALLPGVASSISLFVRTVGLQPEVLPPLMVCAGLLAGLPTILAAALIGGLCIDALSLNPMGVSVVPLALIGLTIHSTRDVLLAESTYAHAMLGTGAGLLAPMATWAIVVLTGGAPLAGAHLLWITGAGAVSGAVLTPACFALLRIAQQWFGYKPWPSVGFRPDREIVRPRR